MPGLVDVNRWFRSYDNPMKEVVEAIRSVVLAVDLRIDECIMWRAPAVDRASKGVSDVNASSRCRGLTSKSLPI